MRETTSQLFENYEVRKTARQKDAFIEFVTKRADSLGYKTKIQDDKSSFRSKNIIVGDINNAKLVCTAHYDTCAAMLVPNFITPRNIFIYILYQLVLIAVMAIVAFSFGALAQILFEIKLISVLVAYFIFLGLTILLIAGPQNKHTANDNTSGVSLLLALMEEAKEDERAKIAFVFFDNEEKGCLGSSAFKKAYGTLEDRLLMNFDCISDGDYIMFVVSKTVREMKNYANFLDEVNSTICGNKTPLVYKSETTLYPSDQVHFKKHVAVASMKKGVFGLYMDKIHTKNDTVYDETNITMLLNMTINISKLL